MNRGPVARIVLAIVFAGLVLSPVIIKRYSNYREGGEARFDAKTALARHGFYLQEVSRSSGVNFEHQAPLWIHV